MTRLCRLNVTIPNIELEQELFLGSPSILENHVVHLHMPIAESQRYYLLDTL